MAERKVLNKYYPPDYDPSKLRRFEKKTVRRMCNVRMMLPMSVRCYTCQNYMYIGTKFNMKVETVKDEDYLGIKVYRFYFKCTRCYAEVTFKTDPKNHDYVAEWGASRNHEQWKDMQMAEEEFKEIKQAEMKEDAMKSLEHRTYDSKREMDILDALDQVKNLNRRQAVLNYDEIIEKAVLEKDKNKEKEIEDKEKLQSKEIFKKLREKRIEDYDIISNNSISNIRHDDSNNDKNMFIGKKKEIFCESENEGDLVKKEENKFIKPLSSISLIKSKINVKEKNSNLIKSSRDTCYHKSKPNGISFLKAYSDSNSDL